MDLSEINKMSDILTNIKREREDLEKKKAQMQKSFEKRMAKNQACIDKLKSQSSKIEKLSYFKRDEIMPVIAYLVSLIEGKKYYYEEIKLPISFNYEIIKDDYSGYSDRQKIRLVYICCNKKKAQEEIGRYISKLKNSSYSREYENLKDFFLNPKDSYIQINIYNNFTGGSTIRFVDNRSIKEVYYEDCHICYEETTNEFRNYLQSYESHIRDTRFKYIIDFMQYLFGKRYESKNHELTSEEMFRYATEFAEEYKKHNVMERIRKR